MNLYVRHLNGIDRYGERLIRNLLSDREGCVETRDICVILKRYASRDFYNLAFPELGDTMMSWEWVRT